MNIAFYAPMKPPDDPTPSGDRQIARLLVRALDGLGHEVTIASRLRSWVRNPGNNAQPDKAERAAIEAERVLAGYRQSGSAPDIWVTYHLYHKAPDWIGPQVASALGIPYVVVEASRALKQKSGPWAFGFAAVDRALEGADAVVALHEDDANGLAAVVSPERLHRLRPFIDTSPFRVTRKSKTTAQTPTLITVAMMRDGDKMQSYEILAQAMSALRTRDWRHVIVGDGAKRQMVESMFDPARTEFVGAMAPEALPSIYARGDIFVWPAVREAFGMVFLEAQAAGLAIVAGGTGGVPEIVADGKTGRLAPAGDATAFTEALRFLLDEPETLRSMGIAAAKHARERHDIAQAKRHIAEILQLAAARRRSVDPFHWEQSQS